MSVTRGEARPLQEAGPQQAWWPQGEQPQWARVTPSDLVAATIEGDDADAVELPALWRLDAFDEELAEAIAREQVLTAPLRKAPAPQEMRRMG